MSGAPRVRCVAFDFDGTLVDSNAIKRQAYDAVLAGVEGAGEAIATVLRERPGDDRHAVLARVHARLQTGGARDLPPPSALVRAYGRLCEERVIACASVPGAVAALDALAVGHVLYLASATPEDALERVVAGRGWSAYFRGVYGGPRSKLANLERIAGREGLAPGELVYVGDGAADREAAARFGCRFFGTGTTPDELPEGPLAALAPLVSAITARAQR